MTSKFGPAWRDQARHLRTGPRTSFPYFLPRICRDDQSLDFAGAFADGAQLDVPIVLLGRVVFHEAVAAEDLDRLVGHAYRHLAGVELGHARFLGEADVFAVGKPRGVIHQQACGFDLRRHIGKLELDGLKLADAFAELLALFGVFHRRFVGALRHSQTEGSDRNAPAVQHLQAVDEAFALLPEQIGGWDATIAEDHFG